jgi:hypothetical protein
MLPRTVFTTCRSRLLETDECRCRCLYTGRFDTAKQIATDNSVTIAQAEQVVKHKAQVLAREIETIKKQAEIRENEAKVEYDREIAVASHNSSAVAEATER